MDLPSNFSEGTTATVFQATRKLLSNNNIVRKISSQEEEREPNIFGRKEREPNMFGRMMQADDLDLSPSSTPPKLVPSSTPPKTEIVFISGGSKISENVARFSDNEIFPDDCMTYIEDEESEEMGEESILGHRSQSGSEDYVVHIQDDYLVQPDDRYVVISSNQSRIIKLYLLSTQEESSRIKAHPISLKSVGSSSIHTITPSYPNTIDKQLETYFIGNNETITLVPKGNTWYTF